MRLTLFAVFTTAFLALVAIWTLTSTIPLHLKDANAAPASASIDATQLMKEARTLPVEQFDAH